MFNPCSTQYLCAWLLWHQRQRRISQNTKEIKAHDPIDSDERQYNSVTGFCRWHCRRFQFHVTTDTKLARAVLSLEPVAKIFCQLSWAAGEEMALKLYVSCSVSFPLGLLGICRTPLTTSVHPIKSAVNNSHKLPDFVCFIKKTCLFFAACSFNLSM